MPEGSPPPRFGRRQWMPWLNSLTGEIILRIILATIFCYMETMPPFVRYVSPEVLESDYKYPRRESYVPPRVMWSIVLCAPCLAAAVGYLCGDDKDDAAQSLLAVSLALGINGIITDTVKVVAGRLRPDYFYRCFPDGVMTEDHGCTGDPRTVSDGRKSFPSGHSSLSFCSLGFVSIWACGRLGVCGRGGAGGARTLASLLPLYVAMLIALSRSCDYHHHWQDIVAGSLLGLTTAYACYRQRYPPLSSAHAGVPYSSLQGSSASEAGSSDTTPLLNGAQRQDNKWI